MYCRTDIVNTLLKLYSLLQVYILTLKIKRDRILDNSGVVRSISFTKKIPGQNLHYSTFMSMILERLIISLISVTESRERPFSQMFESQTFVYVLHVMWYYIHETCYTYHTKFRNKFLFCFIHNSLKYFYVLKHYNIIRIRSFWFYL